MNQNARSLMPVKKKIVGKKSQLCSALCSSTPFHFPIVLSRTIKKLQSNEASKRRITWWGGTYFPFGTKKIKENFTSQRSRHYIHCDILLLSARMSQCQPRLDENNGLYKCVVDLDKKVSLFLVHSHKPKIPATFKNHLMVEHWKGEFPLWLLREESEAK